MIPGQTSMKIIEKIVLSNLQDKRQKQKPKIHQGQLVRAAGIVNVFSKGD